MREGNLEETASWKTHSFTLLVFGGVVALSSIFFVLGMLVGRTQGQKMAEMAAAAKVTAEKPADASAGGSSLTYLGIPEDSPERFAEASGTDEPVKDTARKSTPPERTSPPPATPVAKAAPAKAPAKSPPPARTAAKPVIEPAASAPRIYLQVAAMRQQKDAQRELQNVKGKGFASALILAPAAGDATPLYRVQVGPYRSDAEALAARKQLEAKGFKQILVKK
jgi:cell division protein FtsN